MSGVKDKEAVVSHEHRWQVETFYSPTHCQQCDSMLWGMTKQGVVCAECRFIAHEKCTEKVLTCREVQHKSALARRTATLMPLSTLGRAHEWSMETFMRPTYCSVCTNFIWGLSKQGYRCAICDATAHPECRAGCIADCRPLSSLPTSISLSPSSPPPSSSSSSSPSPSSPPPVSLSSLSISASGGHHYVRGAIKFGQKCVVCDLGFHFSGPSDGYKCSRCDTCIHAKCFEESGREGGQSSRCEPKHAELLYSPPHDLSMSADAAVWAAREHEKEADIVVESEEAPSSTPLIVFINSRSGGGQGKQVYAKLRRLLSPVQVFDLAEGGPKPGLKAFREVVGLQILCCGGDGTCCWVLSVLDEMKWPPPYPPIAILPLGTGNDLARALGWGGGYENEPLSPILDRIPRSTVVTLDRWKVVYAPGLFNPDNPLEEVVDDPTVTSMTMNNYWSIGVDAKVALEFHRKREENPHLFVSRTVNKTWYGFYGMKEMVGQEPLNRTLRLFLDDREVAIPDSIAGVIVLNIQSYAGGCDLWGKGRQSDTRFAEPSMSDGVFEVVGLKGTFHMAKIQTGGGKAKRIGQATKLRVIFNTPCPTQIDGEPRLQEAGSIGIYRHQSGTMIKSTRRRKSSASIANSDIVNSDPLPMSSHAIESPGLGSSMFVDSEVLSDNRNLIAFINSRSGGGQGRQVFQKLKRIISPDRVFDLSDGGPRQALLAHQNDEDLRILCCGGDGTCCWVLSVLDEMKWPPPYPPIAVLPLGTGNDLSRALGWGPGYQGESLSGILKHIPNSVAVSLDRWKVRYTPFPNPPPKEVTPESSEGAPVTPHSPVHSTPFTFTMNNYWSIGVDAKVALDFHRKREENPHLFVSRAVNKTWYGYYGMKEMVGQEPLNRSVTVFLDDEELRIPDDIAGVIVLNIQSYAGGCDLWGKTKNPRFEGHKPSMSDGLFEVVGIKGTFHMAKIQTGGAKAKHLAKASKFEIIFNAPTATQIDGEPKELDAGRILIERTQSGTMLANTKSSRWALTKSDSRKEILVSNRSFSKKDRDTLDQSMSFPPPHAAPPTPPRQSLMGISISGSSSPASPSVSKPSSSSPNPPLASSGGWAAGHHHPNQPASPKLTLRTLSPPQKAKNQQMEMEVDLE